MSFAYAKRFGSRVYIFADTRVSQNGIKLPPDKGVLKTTFLSPQAAISFCQSPDLAARDIDEFSERFGGLFEHADAVAFFENSSRKTNNDYILVFLKPLQIYKIANGKAVKAVSHQVWIGDYDAYRRFREYESGKLRGADLWEQDFWMKVSDEKTEKAFGHVLSAFQHTLSDPHIVSTGDFYTVATNIGSEFKFMMMAKLYLDSIGPYPAMPTSGENFDYRFNTVVPKEAGVNACAFYYPHATKGFVFCPPRPRQMANQCLVVQNKTLNEFADFCRTTLGFDVDFCTTAHPGTRLD